jgi:mono/diheme cytochrome c family protein
MLMKLRLWFAVLSVVLLAATSVLVSAAGKVSPAADARSTYNAKCATCHGRDGRGKTPRGRRTRSRDLTEASWQDDVSDERLFNSIHNGRGKMPAYKKSLSESEIDALVAFVRRLRRQ